MRRRAKKLEVSTFPFLAVLLCCMGSLILVLLVMDRKAKLAARYRVQQASARAAEEAARLAAERKATRDAERAAARDRMLNEARQEWERKRDALHARLAGEEQELQDRLNDMKRQIADITEKHEKEKAKIAALSGQARAEQTKLREEEGALAGSRGKVEATAAQTEQTRTTLVKMTAELVQLEETLRALKAAKKVEGQTYSVVPYRGKHGDNRRPLYVECAADRVVFHPGHKAVHIGDTTEVRAETEQRIARQREQLAKANQPSQTPYLMLLVRPDGVDTYYHLQRALAGLEIDFGYEFVDPDWVLDFPEEEMPAPQPWMTVHNDPVAPARTEPPGTMPRGLPPSRGPLASMGAPSNPGTGSVQSSSGSGNGNSGLPGGIGPSSGSGGPVVLGERRSTTPGGPGGSGSPNGTGTPGSVGAVGVPASMGGPTSTKGGENLFPASTAHQWPGGTSDRVALGPGRPGVEGGSIASAGSGTPGTAGGTTGGEPGTSGTNSAAPSPKNPAENLFPAATTPKGASGTTKSQPGAATSTDGAASPPGTPRPNDAGSSAGLPRQGEPNGGSNSGHEGSSASAGASRTTGNPGGKNASGTGATGDASGEPAPGGASRFAPPMPAPAPRPQPNRPVPLRLARVSDRDWVIYIECRADSLVLYPSRQEIFLKDLGGSATNNPLLVAVQQMISRRQAGLRPEDPPYRPQVRFLLRPENLRTLHAAYPALEALPVPKTRQNLEAEDDPAAIAAGY